MRRERSGGGETTSGTLTCQGVEEVPQLVWVLVEIRVGDHARHILAVEVVVGGVDVPDNHQVMAG